MSLDKIRAAYPHLGLALYALDPGGPVTLEVHADGKVFTARGKTETAVLAKMFQPEEPDPPEQPAEANDIFG